MLISILDYWEMMLDMAKDNRESGLQAVDHYDNANKPRRGLSGRLDERELPFGIMA